MLYAAYTITHLVSNTKLVVEQAQNYALRGERPFPTYDGLKEKLKCFLKKSSACRNHMDGREGDKAKDLTWKNTKVL